MRDLRQILSEDVALLVGQLKHERSEARIEVQSLLQAVLQVHRAYLLAHPEHFPNATQQAEYTALLKRRLAGEPIAYLLGEREFFGLTFKVTPATLIPRPDSELLVEQALARIPADDNRIRALDLGTGTGAIALSIAHARPDATVTAVDASATALEVAQQNAQRLGTHNVRLLDSDWFSALQGERFDLIVSNPPYIAAADPHLVQGDLRFEPATALASGADGLDDIRRIVAEAPLHLSRGGCLLLEHGYDQAERVRALLVNAGFAKVYSAHDLGKIERVSGGCWSA